jgi:hypothetical protein
MRNLVIFDIDGVLLSCQHRVQHWMDGDFDTYASLALKDSPIPQGVLICWMFLTNPNYRVLFVTGRGDANNHREDTLVCLRQHIHTGIRYDQLLMREWPLVDSLGDAEKKPLMIQQAGYSLDDIFMVFEDRDSIVEMWRTRGIVCYQTQPSDFSTAKEAELFSDWSK